MRCTVIVLDSLGAGELPDAANYGDSGSNTLRSVVLTGKAHLPNMAKMGLFNIDGLDYAPKNSSPSAAYGKLAERSPGKDTTTGHWELMGKILSAPFPTFKKFPPEIVEKLESAFGRKILGNKAASGTVIIEELGQEHMRTGRPIIYTSADSLMQIAMHEQIIPLERQYEICRIARELLMGDDTVSRIICRPFVGSPETGFTRTENRKDFSIDPPGKTVLEYLKDAGRDVIAVGKIEDIFNNVGITEVDHTRNNREGIASTLKYLERDFDGLLFVNLVDFDMLYGHRNNARGYAEALEYFDEKLPEILALLKEDDILLITADHGCDPTTKGTDHTREYIPLLVYGPRLKSGVNLHVRGTFADIAATVADRFDIHDFPAGTSFLPEVTP